MPNRIMPSAALVVLAACGGTTDPGPDPGPKGPITVTARPASTDTVTASPIQGLVVEIRNANGGVVPGTVVRFQGLRASANGPASMLVRPLSGTGYADLAVATTDVYGRAAVQVQFGTIAGPGRIQVTVPELGIADTVDFTVNPGNLDYIDASPGDTAMHPGGTVQLRPATIDRFGNPRADPVTWTASSTPAGAAQISGSGLVTATAPARLRIIVARDTLRDTAFVSVVPPGSYLANFNNGITYSDLDGTGRRTLYPGPLGYSFEATWSPDGTQIAFGPSRQGIEVVSFAGGPLGVLSISPTVGEPYWVEYAPDGRSIYFSAVQGSPNGINRFDLNTGNYPQVLQCLCYRPTVSPSGRFMAFHTLGAGSDIVVRIYDMQTQAYVGGEIPGRFPEWSPAGNGIAFHENETGRIELINEDGSNRRHLTPPGLIYDQTQQLSWSTSGAWLLAGRGTGFDLIEVSTGMILPLPGTLSMFQPALKP